MYKRQLKIWLEDAVRTEPNYPNVVKFFAWFWEEARHLRVHPFCTARTPEARKDRMKLFEALLRDAHAPPGISLIRPHRADGFRWEPWWIPMSYGYDEERWHKATMVRAGWEWDGLREEIEAVDAA